MNHIGTQYIETERLILRRFEPSDAPAVCGGGRRGYVRQLGQ